MTSTVATTTPVPDRAAGTPAHPPIAFGRLVGVEWRKATDTRAARWLIAIVGVAMIAIMLVPLLADGTDVADDFLGPPVLAMTTLLPVVAILTLTTEWTRRSVLATFTQEPRRGRVLAAKVSVCMLLGLAGAAFAWLLAAVSVVLAAASGRAIDTDLDALRVIGNLAFMMLIMLKAVAFGALLANSAAAIVAFFVVPTAFAILGDSVDAVGHWLDTAVTFGWIYDADWSGNAAQIVVSTLVWVLAPLVAGLVVTVRREVT